MTPLEMLFWLLVAHAVCDYPLQGDFLARAKNHRLPVLSVPWQQALVWHALIHGGAVALVTGSVPLGLAETAAHALIDHWKCRSDSASSIPFGVLARFAAGETAMARLAWTSRALFHVDQVAHVVCKMLWLLLLVLP